MSYVVLFFQVNDLDSPDYPLTLATTSGYQQYPPAFIFTNVKHCTCNDDEVRMPFMPSPCVFWPTFPRRGEHPLQEYSMMTGSVGWQPRAEFSQQMAYSNLGGQHNDLALPMDVPLEPPGPNLDRDIDSLLAGMEVATDYVGTGNMENINWQHVVSSQQSSACDIGSMDAAHDCDSSIFRRSGVASRLPNNLSGQGVDSTTTINLLNFPSSVEPQMPMGSADGGNFHQYIPVGDLPSWQFPFIRGWKMDQMYAGLHVMRPVHNAHQVSVLPGPGSELVVPDVPCMHSVRPAQVSSAMATPGHSRDTGQNLSGHRSHSRVMVSTDTAESIASLCTQLMFSLNLVFIASLKISIFLAETAATELPCTVKLRIWAYDIQVPCTPLDVSGRCLLTVPHAVLCRSYD